MTHSLISGLGVLLLVGLLYFEKKGRPPARILTKSMLSLLFVITVLLQPGANEIFTRYLTLGLLLCLVGDVCLAFSGLK